MAEDGNEGDKRPRAHKAHPGAPDPGMFPREPKHPLLTARAGEDPKHLRDDTGPPPTGEDTPDTPAASAGPGPPDGCKAGDEPRQQTPHKAHKIPLEPKGSTEGGEHADEKVDAGPCWHGTGGPAEYDAKGAGRERPPASTRAAGAPSRPPSARASGPPPRDESLVTLRMGVDKGAPGDDESRVRSSPTGHSTHGSTREQMSRPSEARPSPSTVQTPSSRTHAPAVPPSMKHRRKVNPKVSPMTIPEKLGTQKEKCPRCGSDVNRDISSYCYKCGANL